jgi:hypothetical protein
MMGVGAGPALLLATENSENTESFTVRDRSRMG